MTRKNLFLAVVFAAAAVSVVILASSPPAGASYDVIKIGYIGPLSGDAGVFGETERNSIELAVGEINNAGGVRGKNIEVIYEDGKCDGKDATIAAQKLISMDKVKVILGGACSGETLAIAPVSERGKVVLFSVFSSNPAISDAGEYIFRSVQPDTQTGKLVAEDMIKKYGKAAILSENTDFAQGVRSIFKEDFAKLGGTVVADEIYGQGEKDFRTYISKIKGSGFGALFIIPQSGVTQGLAVKQSRELGIDGQIYSTVAASDAVEIGGKAMEGLIVVDAPYLPERGNGFISRYKQLYGTPANEYVAAARYDSVFIIADAMKRCGEDSGCMKDYLYGMEPYEGMIGRYAFDGKGDIDGVNLSLRILVNGSFLMFG